MAAWRDWLKSYPLLVGLGVVVLLVVARVGQQHGGDISVPHIAAGSTGPSKILVAQLPPLTGAAAGDGWQRQIAEADLRAKQSIATWAMLTFFAVLAGVGLLGAALWEVRRFARATGGGVAAAAPADGSEGADVRAVVPGAAARAALSRARTMLRASRPAKDTPAAKDVERA